MKLRAAALAFAALSVAGCAKKTTSANAYRLSASALTPPAQKQPLAVAGVRGGEWSPSACRVRVPPYSLEWKDGKALLRSSPAKPEDADDRVLEQFRASVVELEAKGCLKTGGSSKVLDAFASMLALPSGMLYAARWGTYYQSAALDFQPEFRLKIIGPLLKAGAKDVKVDAAIPDKPGGIVVKSIEGLEGFETSYYRIVSGKPEGVTLQLVSVEHSRNGVATPVQRPSGFALKTMTEPRQMRLLFLRRVSKSDRDITLLSAKTLAQLEAATQRMQDARDAVAQCRAEREAECLALPRLTALNLELVVTANSREVSVPIGATVSAALEAAGVRGREQQRATLPTLTVRRPWRGKMIPVTPLDERAQLLSMVLIGGEQVRW